MDAIGSSLSGMRASLARLDASAARVARASASPATTGPAFPVDPASTANIDLASEMIEQLTAKLTYDANLSVAKTADEMQHSLIRRWA
jgi:flagellar basal body rod protein FlgB